MLGFCGGIKVQLSGNFIYKNMIELLSYWILKNKFDNLYISYIKFTIGLKLGYFIGYNWVLLLEFEE